MLNLQQIRERILALKIDKSDNSAELAELNARMKSQLPRGEFRQLNARRTELASDQADIDGELAQLNARILVAEHQETVRAHHVNAVRNIVCAMLPCVPHTTPASEIIAKAMEIEAALQATIPPVTVPDLPADEEEHDD